MEKTTLEALGWQLKSSDNVRPIPPSNDAASAVAAHKASVNIRRRFQFSSALKRMSTVSTLQSGKPLACVKGAPETIRAMLRTVPGWYDETYKWYTRRGSRVLALAFKEMHGMNFDKVHLSDGQSVEWKCLHSFIDQPPPKGTGRERLDLCRVFSFPLPTEKGRGRDAQNVGRFVSPVYNDHW